MKATLFYMLALVNVAVHAQEAALKPSGGSLHPIPLFDKASHPGVACFRIPALVTAPNGDLIAAVDERVPSCDDLRGNKDINIVIRRSQDNGTTWSNIETVVDYPFGQSTSDPSMIVDHITGSVFLFFNFMDLDKANGDYCLRVMESHDNGKSWGAPRDITTQITKPGWQHDFMFITSGRGIQTASGKLLHTLVNMDKGLFVFGSDDHGKSWFLLNMPIKPGDESKLVELADGRWMINSRVNGAGFRYVHTTSDDGNTWQTQPDSSLIDPGCNASIIRYTSKGAADKKLLLFSNANSNDERKNLTVRVSYDDGKHWPEQKTIDAGSAAYSSLTILDNGDIGLLYEKDDYQEIAFVRFTLDWLADGRDQIPRFNKP